MKKNKDTIEASTDAEKAVLYSIIVNDKIYDEIREILKPEDFLIEAHKIIYSAFEDMISNNQKIELIGLINFLKNKNISTGEDFYFIHENRYVSQNYMLYAKEVKKKSIANKMLKKSQELKEMVLKNQHDSNIDFALEAEKIMFDNFKHKNSNNEMLEINEILKMTFQRMEEKKETGVKTGFKKLDELTGGFQKSDLIVIAARPSMGKTTFAMNIASNVSQNDKTVLFMSLEMGTYALANRLLSSFCKISQSKFRESKFSDDEFSAFSKAAEKLHDKKLYIYAKGGLKVSDVVSACRKCITKSALDLLVIDYLQLMKTSNAGQNRNLEISEITSGLKSVAVEFDIPVVVLSQLNRGLENRQEKRPVLSDLRDSGAIEQDADLVIFLYREEVYFPATLKRGIAEANVAKHRNGELRKIDLTFSGQFSLFGDPSGFDFNRGN